MSGGAHKPAATLRLRSYGDGFSGQGCASYENKILVMHGGQEQRALWGHKFGRNPHQKRTPEILEQNHRSLRKSGTRYRRGRSR